MVAGATASFSTVNERELRRRRYDLEALARMARSLEESEGSASAAEVLVSSVADVYDFERVVLLASSDGEDLAALAAHGNVAVGAPMVPEGEASVMARARARREVELVTHLDPTQDPWLDALLPDARKIAVFPLTVETRSIGVLCVEHSMRRGSRIERRVVSTIERFVSHGALTLHNAWLLERIRQLAHTDGLTGLTNRDTFDKQLSSELSRATRHDERVSLLMVDVDHFKLLNDAHGHVAGDDVLRRVAGQLREACREQDTIARYGGEEFAIVLPNTERRRGPRDGRPDSAPGRRSPGGAVRDDQHRGRHLPSGRHRGARAGHRRRRGPLPLQARRTRPGHGRRPAGRRRRGLATPR